jgi:hypothetical protein
MSDRNARATAKPVHNSSGNDFARKRTIKMAGSCAGYGDQIWAPDFVLGHSDCHLVLQMGQWR